MRAGTCLLLIAVAVCGLGIVRLGVAAPSTVPATAPATLPASAATPRDALKIFAAGLRAGNAAQLRSVVLTTQPAQERILGGMASLALALAQLNTAAASAFGEREAAAFTDDSEAQFARNLARIDGAEVTVHDDRASIRYADAKEPFELRRCGGLWKIPAAVLTPISDTRTLDLRLAELNAQAKIVTTLTADISSGKFNNAESARESWRARIMQALPSHPPTTGVSKE